jgi:hypothetical protein
MIYLIWSLLNLFLILSFFYFAIGLIVKGRKFLEPYFKPFVFSVLVFGIMGLISSITIGSKRETLLINHPTTRETFLVSEQLSNTLSLTVYRSKETGEIIQEFSSSDLQGLVMGLSWKHLYVVEKNGQLQLEGWWDWSLMGNRVFRNFRTYPIADNNPALN